MKANTSLSAWSLVLLIILPLGLYTAHGAADILRATLNDVTFSIDQTTGGIVAIDYAGKQILKTAPEQAGIIDLAYPIEAYTALRLAPRYARNVEITQSASEVVLHWPRLAASRDLPRSDEIDVTVNLKAAPDGVSVVMTCRVVNWTPRDIPQVLFPDLAGLRPVAGPEATRIRLGDKVIRPFTELVAESDHAPFYANHPATAGLYEKITGEWTFRPIYLRWLDYGGLREGFSLWEKSWGWEPRWDLWIKHDQAEGTARVSCVHQADIQPFVRWNSGEFWLTPHRYGWAEGIRPYRAWVKHNIRREYEMPKHVREGLGFRTIFMTAGMPPNTREDVVYRIEDLPRVAAEAVGHGLDELVPWFWTEYFQLPFRTLPLLGSDEQMANAVRQCRERGVNVSLFISCMRLVGGSAERYGFDLGGPQTAGWTYHRDMIPMINPPYNRTYDAVRADQDNQAWQEDVLKTLAGLSHQGMSSVVWDVYSSRNVRPNLFDLSARIRKLARQNDPQSVFAGEAFNRLELEAEHLDYTWNWLDQSESFDALACLSAFPAPRFNINIDHDPVAVRRGFMDNLYLNVMPRRLGGVNGSAMLAEYPELSTAVKQCAALRKQFLPYFVEGEMVGECVLAEECPGMHVTAYALPKSLLMIALKREEKGAGTTLKADLKPWLPSASGTYRVKSHAMDGRETATRTTAADWLENPPSLKHGDMVLYEFEPAEP